MTRDDSAAAATPRNKLLLSVIASAIPLVLAASAEAEVNTPQPPPAAVIATGEQALFIAVWLVSPAE